MRTTHFIAMMIMAVGVMIAVKFFIQPAVETREAQSAAAASTVQPSSARQTPPRVSVASDISGAPIANAAILRKEADGHFWANANVDGTSVRFMVDTGASTVALTFRDAQRLGLEPDTLDYRWNINTAGGTVKGAFVELADIKIGQVKIENVDAMVLKDGLTQSLLGMSFLGELHSYEFRQKNLILRK
ncbi:MAG: TIGR02281 family clan AA aspartic protease [Pseudomonadota bacterium]